MELNNVHRTGYSAKVLAAKSGSAPAHPAAPGAAGTPALPLTTTYARFAVDPDTNRVRVTILDASSGEVLRRIPIVDLADLSAVRVPTPGAYVSSAM